MEGQSPQETTSPEYAETRFNRVMEYVVVGMYILIPMVYFVIIFNLRRIFG